MLETLGFYTIHFESSLIWIALPPSELCPAKRRQLSVMRQKRCRKKASLFRGTSPQRTEICPRPWPGVPHYARGMGITVGRGEPDLPLNVGLSCDWDLAKHLYSPSTERPSASCSQGWNIASIGILIIGRRTPTSRRVSENDACSSLNHQGTPSAFSPPMALSHRTFIHAATSSPPANTAKP
jgi:hypothetical protein